MNWFSSFIVTIFPWVMEDINHAWKALELTNLMKITWKKGRKMSFFNWWNFALCFASMPSATVVIYVQNFVRCGVTCLIRTIFMALTIIGFCAGKPLYKCKTTKGNPLTPILQVLITVVRKRNLSFLQILLDSIRCHSQRRSKEGIW